MKIDKNLAIERGQRLKTLRNLSGLNGRDLAKLADLSRASISYWENAPRNKGLTRAGAEKVILALSKIGIECDIGWLWFGVGKSPQVIPKSTSSIETHKFLNEISNSQNPIFSLNKEIELFLTMNNEAVIAKIQDDLMLPMYEKGDIVGGIWQPIQAITTSRNAILKTNNSLSVRKIFKDKNNVKISHLNQEAVDILSLQDFIIEFIAPIIRVWKY